MGRIYSSLLLLQAVYKSFLPSGFRQQVTLPPLRGEPLGDGQGTGQALRHRCPGPGRRVGNKLHLCFFPCLVEDTRFVPTRKVFRHDLFHFLTSLLVNDLHLPYFLRSTKGKG